MEKEIKKPKMIFTDGISRINFLNGLVRITIGTLTTPEKEENTNEQPEFKEDYTLVIPLNSFLAGMQSQEQLLSQLENNNIISKSDKFDNNATLNNIVGEMTKDNVIIPEA
jgi:hypothetical protein